MAAGGRNFENKIVKIFNRHYDENEIDAIAYRLRETRYATQHIDVVSDSAIPMYYLGIECKSVDESNTNALYFSQHFNTDINGVHQLNRIIGDFIAPAGRIGVLAVEIRTGKGQRNFIHCIPLSHVLERYEKGEKGLPFDLIKKYPRLKPERRGWNVAEVLDYQIENFMTERKMWKDGTTRPDNPYWKYYTTATKLKKSRWE